MVNLLIRLSWWRAMKTVVVFMARQWLRCQTGRSILSSPMTDDQFQQAFEHIDLSAFFVWMEKVDGGHLEAGGFLQNCVYGYMPVWWLGGWFTSGFPTSSSRWSDLSMKLREVHYRGSCVDVWWNHMYTTVEVELINAMNRQELKIYLFSVSMWEWNYYGRLFSHVVGDLIISDGARRQQDEVCHNYKPGCLHWILVAGLLFFVCDWLYIERELLVEWLWCCFSFVWLFNWSTLMECRIDTLIWNLLLIFGLFIGLEWLLHVLITHNTTDTTSKCYQSAIASARSMCAEQFRNVSTYLSK